MKYSTYIPLCIGLALSACNADKDALNELNQHNVEMESKGYHFGEQIQLPESVKKIAQKVEISFGEHSTPSMMIDPKLFTLGDNTVTFNITKTNGEVIAQDATLVVYAKNTPKKFTYQVVKEYPHDPKNFVQGFQLDGNTIYESVGQNGESNLQKYTLGTTSKLNAVPQPIEVFSEGSTILGDKVYQLTWQNRKGFIYNKNTFSTIGEFNYPNSMTEGWGLTYDGRHLIASDGSKNLYFLDPLNTEKVYRYISVASDSEIFNNLNELEYHNGRIYANVWQKPIILEINPENGEVMGIIDLTELVQKNTRGTDDVLNGITFKGENMLVTGKNWNRIYELKLNP